MHVGRSCHFKRRVTLATPSTLTLFFLHRIPTPSRFRTATKAEKKEEEQEEEEEEPGSALFARKVSMHTFGQIVGRVCVGNSPVTMGAQSGIKTQVSPLYAKREERERGERAK